MYNYFTFINVQDLLKEYQISNFEFNHVNLYKTVNYFINQSFLF
jgi:hypothetical protein